VKFGADASFWTVRHIPILPAKDEAPPPINLLNNRSFSGGMMKFE
jgi:hypothetical protein